jgi:uncharacterized damage-inducible protein DinB
MRMSADSPYVIGEMPGFSPEIGRLVAMMTYVRRTTLDAVAGLSVAELDHSFDDDSNSIGALLAHIAAVEVAYQLATFDRRGFTGEEMRRWGPALALGTRARRSVKGRQLEDYVAQLDEVRGRTLGELARRDDAWLDETTPFWDDRPANNYFKWFHVFEDELSHRGQIRWLRKRLAGR